MVNEKPIYVGTSGWHYQHWKGPFYPEKITERYFLDEYIKYFKSTEINNSFYNLPDIGTLEQWRSKVPEGFVFSVKANRYITHMKKLKDPVEPFNRFIDRMKLLRDHLGPILFQLPPKWKIDLGRLRGFISILPKDYRYAFEFRDSSWFGTKTEDILHEAGIALCIYDFEKRQSPLSVTTDFVYIRLHGPESAYKGKYSDSALLEWATVISSWLDEGKEIFCYFDNDEAGYAAQNALTLKSMLDSKK
jgi:uncharacterized protein YecE (DUF72 family)